MVEQQTQKNSYRELLPEKEYLKNLCATLISRFGDSIDAIAFSWLVYALTGSASLTAVTYGVNTLVSVLLQPFSAALITGMRKKPIIVWTAAGRGALVCAVAVLHHFGLARPWMLIVTTALISTLEAFGQPAGTAIYPRIISKEKYTLAMSLSGALTRVAEIVGMGLAGVIIAGIGIPGTLLVDAGAFLASAAILATLRVNEQAREKVMSALRQFYQDTKDGFQYAVQNKLFLAICAAACALNFALVPYTSLQAAYVEEGLHLGAQAMSVMGIAVTLGMALGSIVFPKLAAKHSKFSLLFAGVMAASLSYMALAFVGRAPSVALKWALLALALLPLGIGVAFANTSVHVSFMEKTDEEYLARATGIMGSMCMAAVPVGSFIIAAVAKYVNVTTLILGCGVFSVLISLAFLLIKPLRDL